MNIKKLTSNYNNEEAKSLQQRLLNYKKTQAGVAKSKGLEVELASARTLTQARKILYGVKKRASKGKK